MDDVPALVGEHCPKLPNGAELGGQHAGRDRSVSLGVASAAHRSVGLEQDRHCRHTGRPCLSQIAQPAVALQTGRVDHDRQPAAGPGRHDPVEHVHGFDGGAHVGRSAAHHRPEGIRADDLGRTVATCGPGRLARSGGPAALATAQFLADQAAGGSAYVIGEAGLTSALHDAGFVLTETDPDYVVLGETRTYSFATITQAIRLIERGARFIATNPDATGPSAEGPLPATGSVAAMITRASGIAPTSSASPTP